MGEARLTAGLVLQNEQPLLITIIPKHLSDDIAQNSNSIKCHAKKKKKLIPNTWYGFVTENYL